MTKLTWIVAVALAVFTGAAEAQTCLHELSPPPIDLMAVQVNPAGEHLADPFFTMYSDDCPPPIGSGSTLAPGWVEGYNDGIIAIVTGPLTEPIFAGLADFGGEFALAFVFFAGDQLIANGGVAFGELDFPSWVDTPPTRAELDALLRAPEPATLALLGIGLAGLGFSRRARRQYSRSGRSSDASN